MTLQFAEVEIRRFAWTAADGLSAYAGERLTLQGEFSLPAGAPAGFNLNGEITGGEVLFGSYYASLESVAAQFGLQGKIAAGTYHLDQAHIEIPQLGELSLSGFWGAPAARISATLTLPDLQQALASPRPQPAQRTFSQVKRSLPGRGNQDQ